jgi:hypothetical protein
MTLYVRKVLCDEKNKIPRLVMKLTLGGTWGERTVDVSVEYLGF